METYTLELPAMYGDHHVSEVRRILFEIPGVEDVYASSSFRVAEISFDPEKVDAEQINKILDAAGYIGELPMPLESGVAAYLSDNGGAYFRHTEMYEHTQQPVSFAQKVNFSGRALWPCPGVGPIRQGAGEEE
jgi:copper chaperone CopZ